MNSKVSSKSLTVCLYLQYVLFGISFYLFSSKIAFLPWYIPLTTYMLLYILILVILQLILFLYTWYMYERHITFKKIRTICFLHLLFLIIMSFLCIFSISLFNLMSILGVVFIIFLAIYQNYDFKTNSY